MKTQWMVQVLQVLIRTNLQKEQVQVLRKVHLLQELVLQMQMELQLVIQTLLMLQLVHQIVRR